MNRIDRAVSAIFKSGKYDVNPIEIDTPVKAAVWSTIKYELGGQADRDDLYRMLAAKGFVDGNFNYVIKELIDEGELEEIQGPEGLQYVIPGWDIRKQEPWHFSAMASRYPNDEQYDALMAEILGEMTPEEIIKLPGVRPALSEALMDEITQRFRGDNL